MPTKEEHYQAGLKLFYSLLRSLYYCLLYKNLSLDRRQVLTVFLGIKNLIFMLQFHFRHNQSTILPKKLIHLKNMIAKWNFISVFFQDNRFAQIN